jgi:hypothetical protein
MLVLSVVILPSIRPPAYAILNVIVDDKIQFLVGKAVMFCKNLVYSIDDGFRQSWIEFLIYNIPS